MVGGGTAQTEQWGRWITICRIIEGGEIGFQCWRDNWREAVPGRGREAVYDWTGAQRRAPGTLCQRWQYVRHILVAPAGNWSNVISHVSLNNNINAISNESRNVSSNGSSDGISNGISNSARFLYGCFLVLGEGLLLESWWYARGTPWWSQGHWDIIW